MFKRKKPGKAKDDSKKLWEDYLKASLKQDWNKAKDVLQNILNLEPNNSKTHLKMGDLLQKLGDSKGAIKAYHKSASILVKSGFSQKAIALYKIILRLDPKDKQALNDTKRLTEISEHAAAPLTTFSVEESSPLVQTEESVVSPEESPVSEEIAAPEESPISEEITAPEEVPALDDIPPSDRMSQPTDLTSTEEPAAEHVSPPEDWPAAEQASPPEDWPAAEQASPPEAWPEEVSSAPQDEEAFPEFEMEPQAPQDEDTIPEFEMEPQAPQDEEAFPEFEMESSEAEAEDLLLELCIEPSRPIAGEAIEDIDTEEGTKKPAGELKEWTGTLPEIFWSLNKEELTQIFNDSVIASYTTDQPIVNEGDAGDSIFAIMEGTASVQANIGGEKIDLALLKAGDVFGEVAFLTGMPRTATVVANSNMRVMDISRAVLEKAIEKHPRILSCLANYYHNRLNDTIVKAKKAKAPKVRLIVRE
jgi:tetratricopeptide (TPR) repeat protein